MKNILFFFTFWVTSLFLRRRRGVPERIRSKYKIHVFELSSMFPFLDSWRFSFGLVVYVLVDFQTPLGTPSRVWSPPEWQPVEIGSPVRGLGRPTGTGVLTSPEPREPGKDWGARVPVPMKRRSGRGQKRYVKGYDVTWIEKVEYQRKVSDTTFRSFPIPYLDLTETLLWTFGK